MFSSNRQLPFAGHGCDGGMEHGLTSLPEYDFVLTCPRTSPGELAPSPSARQGGLLANQKTLRVRFWPGQADNAGIGLYQREWNREPASIEAPWLHPGGLAVLGGTLGTHQWPGL